MVKVIQLRTKDVRPVSEIKIRQIPVQHGTFLVPSYETPEACNSIGGKMEKGVCILVDGPDGGWTAPIKGSYFAWGVGDMYEATGDDKWKGKFMPDTMGCLVADSSVYPMFAGMCSPIYQGEFYDEKESKEAALQSAKNEVLGIAKDVLKGEASGWGLDYFKPNGRPTKFNEENAIVADDEDSVIRVFVPTEIQKRLEDFQKKRRK